MKWFKFYGQDYLSDPKILALSACDRSCWITLLSYGSINDNGLITFLDEQQLMAQSGISPNHEEWDHTLGVLKKFEKLGMITLDNEVITILNWKKRQETSLTSYERVKRYREKKRKETELKQNDNTRIDKNRIEENTYSKSNDLPLTPLENSLKKTQVKHKTLKEFRNERRLEAGKTKYTPRRTDKQEKVSSALKWIDVFKQKGYDQHGMLFLEVDDEKRNKAVRQLVIRAYEILGDLGGLIDWWFSGNGKWADYEPENCFSTKMIERFKNSVNKSKTGGILR